MVINEHVLLVFGTGHSLLLSFQHSPVTRILHILLCLSQQKLSRRGVQVFLPTILQRGVTKPSARGVEERGKNGDPKLYLFQNTVFLFLFEIVFFDFVGLMEKLQLGWICLEVNFRSLVIGFPSKDCRGNTQNNVRPTGTESLEPTFNIRWRGVYVRVDKEYSRCVWAMVMVSPE